MKTDVNPNELTGDALIIAGDTLNEKYVNPVLEKGQFLVEKVSEKCSFLGEMVEVFKSLMAKNKKNIEVLVSKTENACLSIYTGICSGDPLLLLSIFCFIVLTAIISIYIQFFSKIANEKKNSYIGTGSALIFLIITGCYGIIRPSTFGSL